MSVPLMLTEDEALELLAHLVTAAQTQYAEHLDETCRAVAEHLDETCRAVAEHLVLRFGPARNPS